MKDQENKPAAEKVHRDTEDALEEFLQDLQWAQEGKIWVQNRRAQLYF